MAFKTFDEFIDEMMICSNDPAYDIEFAISRFVKNDRDKEEVEMWLIENKRRDVKFNG